MFNRNGDGAVLGWQCTADGTPGTWAAITLGGSAAPTFNYAEWVQSNPVTAAHGADLTTGCKFQVAVATTQTGVDVYWAGPATTLGTKLYDAAGTVVASGTLAVSGPGRYTIPYSVPYSAPAATPFWATVRDISGSNYTAANTGNGPMGSGAVNFLGGFSPALALIDNAYAAGDSMPSTSSPGAWFGVMPLYL